MALSGAERRTLAAMEKALRAADPAFVSTLTPKTAETSPRVSAALTHGCLWVGMILTLWGFGLAHGSVLVGTLVIAYGSTFLAVAAPTMRGQIHAVTAQLGQTRSHRPR